MTQTFFNESGEFKTQDQINLDNCPFENQEGKFILNEVEVRFKFEKQYVCGMSHLEFKSDKPTLISETGYRSHFLDCDMSCFESMQELIEKFISEFEEPYKLRWV